MEIIIVIPNSFIFFFFPFGVRVGGVRVGGVGGRHPALMFAAVPIESSAR